MHEIVKKKSNKREQVNKPMYENVRAIFLKYIQPYSNFNISFIK